MDDAQTEAQSNEEKVFGKDPPRAADGKPLERGIGSNWQKMHPSVRAHYLAVELQAMGETLLAQADTLAETARKFAEAHKAVLAETAKAQSDLPPVVEEVKVEEVQPRPLPARTFTQPPKQLEF